MGEPVEADSSRAAGFGSPASRYVEALSGGTVYARGGVAVNPPPVSSIVKSPALSVIETRNVVVGRQGLEPDNMVRAVL
jgi:hypothetical protein